MSRRTSREPTDGELEILRILWQEGPCELGVVRQHLQSQREVATTTVATMLKVMLDKGLVKRSDGGRGYLWASRVTQRATQRKLLHKLLASAFDGSAAGLVAHMVEDGNLSDHDRAAILRLLDDPGDGGRDDG